MKFKIQIRSMKDGHTWWEHYKISFPYQFTRNILIVCVEDYGPGIVAWFNSTLKPGESEREFVSLELEEGDE